MRIDSQVVWKGKEAILAAHQTAGKTGLEIAIMMQSDAKLLCPAFNGHLRSSIVIADRNGVKKAGVKGQIPDISIPKNDDIHVGTAMPYAAYVEYGTGAHKTANKSEQFRQSMFEWCRKKGLQKFLMAIIRKIRMKGTKPHPYMRPAFDRVSGKAVTVMQDEATKQFKIATEKYMK